MAKRTLLTQNHHGTILRESPEKVAEVLYQFFEFCNKQQYPVSKIALINWLGVTESTFNGVLNTDSEQSLLVQKALDLIKDIRISMTDEGKLNPVWNIFILSNDHDMMRKDPQQALNIQINQNSFSSDQIAAELSAFDI